MGPLYDLLLVLHFLGLSIGVGAGFANMRLGLATQNMPPEERTRFFMTAFALAKNGSYGLLLLIVSGIGMMLMRGVKYTFAWGGPAFHAKLTLIVLFIGAFGYMQVLIKRAREAQGGPNMAKVPKIGSLLLLLAVGIVICAVLAFH